ncbi:hypothetical protein [Xanthovirga aplysinae]|uniref:hypothetical protein n=1 Tax=Xanthovirga aplysinae TaxID=2529853 RepID=UPI0012BD58B7|nr:hypothetical protein [Xanthovirga aplysinae]MTI31007.1 hypothetical protein [Xanthovirga aplysinae]
MRKKGQILLCFFLLGLYLLDMPGLGQQIKEYAVQKAVESNCAIEQGSLNAESTPEFSGKALQDFFKQKPVCAGTFLNFCHSGCSHYPSFYSFCFKELQPKVVHKLYIERRPFLYYLEINSPPPLV